MNDLQNAPVSPAPAGRSTLLVVDDDAINCGILKHIFSPYYNIGMAHDGQAGLDYILERQDSLCAVLLDVVMPRMDGLQVLRQLAARGLPERIPVFLITAEASGSVMKEAYELGVMDVIGKPITPYVVLRRVQSVVELFQGRQRLRNVVQLQKADLLAQAQQIIELNRGDDRGSGGRHRVPQRGVGGPCPPHPRYHPPPAGPHAPGPGLSDDVIEEIALASIMHDVGKIAVPDSILNKPGRLTAEEFEIMKGHTVQGAACWNRSPSCGPTALIPMHGTSPVTTTSGGTAGATPTG